jgi:D-alanine-D-alanine ligase
MRVVVLHYLESENAKTRDVVVEQVATALQEGGHKTSIFGVHGDARKLLSRLSRRKPDLVFNLMEMFGDNLFGDVAVVGFLDLLGLPHTGGSAGETYLQQDKAISKKLLAFDGIAYPDFAIFTRDSNLETDGHLRMPLLVKPLRADASIGIDGSALVHSPTDMMKRVLAIHRQVKDSALVEEYVEGREFYVAILGNQDAVAFRPIEMDFSGLPEGAPRIVGTKAKWSKSSAEYKGTKALVADLPDELRARLQKVALDSYRAVRVRDYGRIDRRLTDAGEIYVIEVNANCYLERSEEFDPAIFNPIFRIGVAVSPPSRKGDSAFGMIFSSSMPNSAFSLVGGP